MRCRGLSVDWSESCTSKAQSMPKSMMARSCRAVVTRYYDRHPSLAGLSRLSFAFLRIPAVLLFGAIYAGLAVLAWLPIFGGELELWTAFSPVDWHVHEMLYGYVPAVVTGFLL